MKLIAHSIFIVLFLAACQYSALSQEPRGSIASVPDLETGNVYCEIEKPNPGRKYYVFRNSRRLAALEIISTVGDFGAVARVAPRHACSLIKVGDTIHDTSIVIPPEEIEETRESATALPSLHPIAALGLQQPSPMPTPPSTPPPPSDTPGTSLSAVFGPAPSPSQLLVPAPTPAITGYDLKLLEPPELLEGTYAVTAVPGKWYTILLRVSYATPPNTLLVAEIIPDAEQALVEIQRLSGDAQRSRIEQFYKTVHFDTQNTPGFTNLDGQEILSFSLKGQMVPQQGAEIKIVRITLHSLPDWETQFQVAYNFSLQTKSPTP